LQEEAIVVKAAFLLKHAARPRCDGTNNARRGEYEKEINFLSETCRYFSGGGLAFGSVAGGCAFPGWE